MYVFRPGEEKTVWEYVAYLSSRSGAVIARTSSPNEAHAFINFAAHLRNFTIEAAAGDRSEPALDTDYVLRAEPKLDVIVYLQLSRVDWLRHSRPEFTSYVHAFIRELIFIIGEARWGPGRN